MQTDIAIIDEFPSPDGGVLTDKAGSLFFSLLRRKTSWTRDNLYVTSVLRSRPPKSDLSEWTSDNKRQPADHPDWVRHASKWCHPSIPRDLEFLKSRLSEIRPRLVISLGNAPLWLLFGESGVTKWRGSRLSPPDHPFILLPTLSPSTLFRQNDLIPLVESDLARALAIYEGRQTPKPFNFILEPPAELVLDTLSRLRSRGDAGPLLLSGDVETRSSFIDCFGIAWSDRDSLTIPFTRADHSHVYSLDDEAAILLSLWALFRHPNITWAGHNFIYDCQYFLRYWHVLPRNAYDTMIGHHSVFSNLRKSLSFVSSLHADDHVYWKEMQKESAKDE